MDENTYKMLRQMASTQRKMLRLQVDTDDVVQEALVKGLKSGQEALTEGGWATLVASVAKDALRAQKRALKAEGVWLQKESLQDIGEGERIDEALEGASFEEKKLVRMLRNGYSLKEAADACGLSGWQARKRLLRLRNSVTEFAKVK